MSTEQIGFDAIGDLTDDMPQEQTDEKPPQWRLTGPECVCGADITEWHSESEARQMVRVFGTDGEVPACPNCASHSKGVSTEIEGVAKAVKTIENTSSAERVTREERIKSKLQVIDR